MTTLFYILFAIAISLLVIGAILMVYVLVFRRVFKQPGDKPWKPGRG